MKIPMLIPTCFLSAVILTSLFPASAQTDSAPAKQVTTPTATERDGQHDFDFLFGSWKIHMKKRLHPLTGSNQWIEFDGTARYWKVWDGRANIDEFETHGAGGIIEGLTLRTYNPQTHQWSLYWANSKDGVLATPQFGEFKNGRGEFYAQDTLNGKSIFVRFVWSNTTGAPHFEQSFSNDGGQTWEVNWISDQTRIPDEAETAVSASATSKPESPATAEREGQHDFDFELGSWKIHLKRRLNPLTGSNHWVEFDGTSVTRKVWNGRSQLEQFETDGTGGHIEGLTLRTYNPQTHLWRLYWANSKDGIVLVPQIGKFKDEDGLFYAQDMLNDKSIFIRFDWSRTTTNSPHFEQSFSDDGGKTWEVNWITDQTRVPNPNQNEDEKER